MHKAIDPLASSKSPAGSSADVVDSRSFACGGLWLGCANPARAVHIVDKAVDPPASVKSPMNAFVDVRVGNGC